MCGYAHTEQTELQVLLTVSGWGHLYESIGVASSVFSLFSACFTDLMRQVITDRNATFTDPAHKVSKTWRRTDNAPASKHLNEGGF